MVNFVEHPLFRAQSGGRVGRARHNCPVGFLRLVLFLRPCKVSVFGFRVLEKGSHHSTGISQLICARVHPRWPSSQCIRSSGRSLWFFACWAEDSGASVASMLRLTLGMPDGRGVWTHRLRSLGSSRSGSTVNGVLIRTSRQASRPASLATLAPWNSSLRARSNPPATPPCVVHPWGAPDSMCQE